jgi:hypothetical protein
MRVVPAAELPSSLLPGLKSQIRQRMRRAGMRDVVAIGGFEASYKQEDRTFVLHAHICVIGATNEQVGDLAEAFEQDSIPKAFEAQELRSQAKQLSYLLKLTDYHRPGQQSGPRKTRAYPLPSAAFAAWARWTARLSFEDLTFLLGTRKAGHRIVPLRRRQSGGK